MAVYNTIREITIILWLPLGCRVFALETVCKLLNESPVINYRKFTTLNMLNTKMYQTFASSL